MSNLHHWNLAQKPKIDWKTRVFFFCFEILWRPGIKPRTTLDLWATQSLVAVEAITQPLYLFRKIKTGPKILVLEPSQGSRVRFPELTKLWELLWPRAGLGHDIPVATSWQPRLQTPQCEYQKKNTDSNQPSMILQWLVCHCLEYEDGVSWF